MTHFDHGNWIAYKPEAKPEAAPANTLFCKRESDGADWYEYVNSGAFSEDTVKLAAIMREEIGYVVGPATHDATQIFPAGHIVVEIADYGGSDPQKDFGNKVYDPMAGSFSDQPPLQAPELQPSPTETKILEALDSIMGRLEKLERKK